MPSFAEWVEEVAPVAYGVLRLRPWEFERLTPSEFFAMARHAIADRQEEEDFLARIVAPLVNAAGAGKVRHRVTQEDLLGRPTQLRRRQTAEWKKQRELDVSVAE